MSVIIATEGVSEYRALPEILKSVRSGGGALNARVLKISCQPDGPVRGIARSAKVALNIASAKKAELFVLVLDREQRAEAPGDLAAEIASEIFALDNWRFRLAVVMKDRMFENWLVADLGALRKQPARFTVTDAMARRVEPNKADRVDATKLLEQAAIRQSYDKQADSLKIAKRMDIDKAALHSRSLRHLLHVLGHETYMQQCRQPG